MAKRAKVKMLSAGVQALLNSAEAEDDLSERAARIRDAAAAGAPVETGAYRDSIEFRIVRHDRVVAQVYADVDYALEVEAKTGNLARSLDAAGGA